MLVAAAWALALPHADTVHPKRLELIAEVQATPGLLWRPVAQARFAAEAPGASLRANGVLSNGLDGRPTWGDDVEAAVAAGKVTRFVSRRYRDADIPASFDSAAAWPQCARLIGDIRDQSDCGCCWAFAGVEAASDRMCIATNGTVITPLSTQDICFCSSWNGCNGGDILTPWQWISHYGAVSGGQVNGSGPFAADGLCSSFTLPHCHHHGPLHGDPYPAEKTAGCPKQRSAICPTACDAGASPEHRDFKADKVVFDGSVESASGEPEIQKMILEGGPVEAAFNVFEDFEDYGGGIYHYVKGRAIGAHAIKIVGWGVEGGVKYWKVANSWNKYWGEEGYFRVLRGKNMVGIEAAATAAPASAKWHKKDAAA